MGRPGSRAPWVGDSRVGANPVAGGESMSYGRLRVAVAPPSASWPAYPAMPAVLSACVVWRGCAVWPPLWPSACAVLVGEQERACHVMGCACVAIP